MLSQNIKALRMQKGLTQKELADLLHVTSQAVSRWELGDVEPSIDTLSSMAKIFGVTTDEIIGGSDSKPKPEVVKEVEEKIVIQQAKPVLAVCDHCHKPIYDGKDMVRKTEHHGRSASTVYYICKSCDTKIRDAEKQAKIDYGVSRRKKSFVWSSLAAIAVLLVCLIVSSKLDWEGYMVALTVVAPVLSFTFISCLFLANTALTEIFESVSSWGFVTFPGLIFSFDLDGIIWVICMKVLFWILGILLGIGAFLLALGICMPISLIVYPFSLTKNLRHPELTDED